MSTNPSVATVNAAGVVTALRAGSAHIMVMTVEGRRNAFALVTVTPAPVIVPVTGVTLAPATATINAGATQQLTALVEPAHATNQAVTWSSSNTAVATVAANGLVTGVRAGTAVITVRTAVGDFTATSTITVVVPAPAPRGGPFAYIPNHGDNTVTVIDTGNNTVIATVNVGTGPTGVAVNPAGSRLYVANHWGNTVSVIDTGNNTVIATVNTIESPAGVAVHPAGTRVYVTNYRSNTVSVIDTGSSSVVGTVAVGGQPIGVAVNHAGSRLYVANNGGNTVSVIDTGNNTVVATVNVGMGPVGVAVNHAGSRLYVANHRGNTVSVIDTGNNAVVATVNVGSGPYGVAVNPAGSRLYVANMGSNTVSVIDTTTNTVVGTIAVGLWPTAHGKFIVAPPPTPAAVPVTGVGIAPLHPSVVLGRTLQMQAAISPTNATNQTVTWASSDTAIATIAADGLVTARALGTTTISATTVDGGHTATATLTVTPAVPVTGVLLTPSVHTLTAGSNVQLVATVLPINATNQAVVWVSTNPGVATVNAAGVVTALRAGIAHIMVITVEGRRTAFALVTVTPAVTGPTTAD